MHISLVLLFCVFIVATNAAATSTTRRVGQVNNVRLTSKAPVRKTPYDYLRAVRGKSSCASGPCPFWEQHGRSFVSLRCYEQQYKECTCLHRMCFKSCMFKVETCNQEMVSCLRQICPRCMPASELAMCKIYDSTVGQVASSLKKFACYSGCHMLMNNGTNSRPTSKPGITTPPINNMRPVGNGMTTIRTNQAGNSANGARPGNALPNTINSNINANRAPQIPRQVSTVRTTAQVPRKP
ncbi:unnamed protein product [Rotaria magnacalcarata]|uniref:Uncharacterized protein n=1 Tax=Rotaria magnacalcarata TaxID=392030 RepID=A0A816QUC9_9BILA|nr:unnamed protein product [Rotaria magnacalcarata]CAF2145902.1 unnamed protein product [Rotaria magnacalcarata]